MGRSPFPRRPFGPPVRPGAVVSIENPHVRPDDDPAPERTERGFAVWGRITCTYGTEVTVQDSSAASYPRIWLFLTEDHDILRDSPPGEAAAHLSLEQAREVVDALSSAISEAHRTWDEEDEDG